MTSKPAAVAVWNRVLFDRDWYLEDYLPEYPDTIGLIAAMLFAHELTHVWQWQNRDVTGYTAMRALKESWHIADPYFSASTDAPVFFAFGYEQQAAIVEDFVCFSVANPTHPRHDELKEILEPVLPVDQFQAAIR